MREAMWFMITNPELAIDGMIDGAVERAELVMPEKFDNGVPVNILIINEAVKHKIHGNSSQLDALGTSPHYRLIIPFTYSLQGRHRRHPARSSVRTDGATTRRARARTRSTRCRSLCGIARDMRTRRTFQ